MANPDEDQPPPYRSYTNFNNIRDRTSRATERDALLGQNYWRGSDTPQDVYGRSNPYSLLETVIRYCALVATFCLMLSLGPGLITAWRGEEGPFICVNGTHPALRHPVEPLPPYKRAGLSGDDSPWPGRIYIITEANTSAALTYYYGSVRMSEYEKGLANQRWTCHEGDGWLGFTSVHESTDYLGYAAWPSGPKLICSAKRQEFNEQFSIRKQPEGGFQIQMRNGYGLQLLGRDGGGTLVRGGSSDVWWRFSEVH